MLRRTVYFLEGHIYRGFRLFEYDLARDATREIDVLTYGGVVLHDVVEGNSTRVTALACATRARLLTPSDQEE